MWKTVVEKLEGLEQSINKKLGEFVSNPEIMNVTQKGDMTPVTDFDLYVSNVIKDAFEDYGYNFYSEEEHGDLTFPAVVLDPIDGTREFVKLMGECAVSLAIVHSKEIADKTNFGWIYNPFSGFQIRTQELNQIPVNFPKDNLLGLVSRSEWNKNPEKFKCNDMNFSPRGSIAFKLGLLAANSCDFVVTFRPKSLWDIAAGTLICHERGIYLFDSKGNQIETFEEKFMDPPYIWARKEHIESIVEGLCKKK